MDQEATRRAELTAAAVFDFVSEYLEDHALGGVRPLREYLAHYPGHEEEVAEEYLRLAREDRRGAGESETEEGGESRVGAYRLLRELGSGGQGTVYLADDTRIERQVALKLLAGGFVSEERRRRFRREAESIARLEHPGICRVHEADIEGETPYIAMQYVEGLDLGTSLAAAAAERRQDARGMGGGAGFAPRVPWVPRTRVDLLRVLHFFERAARALHAAHEAGVVHRDIKPGNIIVNTEGLPVLLDFGLAREEEGGEAITRSGEVFGTPLYMSPEQLRGLQHELDRRTDVYSLGVVLHEALVGERPFTGEDRFELERAILFAPVPDPRESNSVLDEDVKVVLETAMDKDRGRRYPTALALAEDLRRIREYEPIAARPASTALRVRRWARRQPALATALAVTLLSLSAGLAVALVLLAEVQRNLDRATSRYLSDRAVQLAGENPSTALALALEAVRLEPAHRSRSALFAPLATCHLERVFRAEDAVRAWDVAHDARARVVATAFSDARGSDERGVPRLGGGVLAWELDTGRVLLDERFDEEQRSVALSPDGARLACGSAGGTLRVFELRGGTAVFERSLGGTPLVALAWDPESALLAALDAGGVHLFDGADGASRGHLAGGVPDGGRLVFGPRGERLLVAGVLLANHSLQGSPAALLWDVPGRARVATLEPAQPLRWADLSPDGTRAVTASSDGLAQVWDASTGAASGAPLVHDAPVQCAAFSPDGLRLVTSTDQGERSRAYVWDLASGARMELVGHAGLISHVAFAPDGARVATSCFDTTVRVFDAVSGELLVGCREFTRPLRTTWTPDGRRLLTLSPSPWTLLWRSWPGPDVYRLAAGEGPVRWAAFAADGERAFTGGADGRVRAWSTPVDSAGEAAHGALLWEAQLGAPVVGGGLTKGGRTALVWGGAFVRAFDCALGAKAYPGLVLDAPVRLGVLDRERSRVALISDDGRATLWPLAGEPIELDGHTGAVTGLAFAPDGSSLVTVSDASEVLVRDPDTGAKLRSLVCEIDGLPGIEAVAFAHDGGQLALACRDNRVRRIDLGTFETLTSERLFRPHFVSFGAGDRLAIASRRSGNAVRVLDALGGAPLRPRLAHARGITQLGFLPGGVLLATASEDATVIVLDTRTGVALSRFPLHAAEVTALDSSGAGDSLRVLSADAGGVAWVWPADPAAAARARKPRDLEPWERKIEIELSAD